MDLINNTFTKIFTPFVDLLKKEGLWEYVVSAYLFIKKAFIGLLSLTEIKWMEKIELEDAADFFVRFLKFLVDLFITLFHVIISIVGWILALFK